MKSNKQVAGLLKAIFFLAISSVMLILGYVISGGEGNSLTTVFIYAGIVCFIIGTFIGVANFKSSKDND